VLSIAMTNKRTKQQMQQGELIDTARYVESDRCVSTWVIYSTSDLRGPWPPLDHAKWLGVELLEFTPIDL